jgi:hypothetical protein
MKTPMQELLEWVRATLPMDLETPRLIEQKIQSMLEKEKEQIMDAYEVSHISMMTAEQYYNETFNTKER